MKRLQAFSICREGWAGGKREEEGEVAGSRAEGWWWEPVGLHELLGFSCHLVVSSGIGHPAVLRSGGDGVRLGLNIPEHSISILFC